MQRILIVEDDKEIAILERDYLEINGFETEIISNGQKALTAILENRFDPGPAGPDAAGMRWI